MIKADEKYKKLVTDILAVCFDTNRSVNYIIKQDEHRKERVRALIDYSFEVCLNSDGVLLSDDEKATILFHNSDDKLPILSEALLTLQFVFRVTGLSGISRVFKREKYIKSFHPQDQEYVYIWFIGVSPQVQRGGVGSTLLQEVIASAKAEGKGVYLETSVEGNLGFYKKNGFELYHTSDENLFGYKLYFLRHNK